MADLSKPLRIMKRILILLLALIPFVAKAQEYIEMDTYDENGRTVVTKMTPILVNGKVYAMRFVYSKMSASEIYYTSIACCSESSLWEIQPQTIGRFEMATGKTVELKTLIESNPQKLSDGQYMITMSYIIPENKIHDMLDALLNIHIKTDTGGFTIPIDFETASSLMMSYLELLSETGR